MQPAHNILFPLNDTFGPGNGAFLDARTDLLRHVRGEHADDGAQHGVLFQGGHRRALLDEQYFAGRGSMSYVTGSRTIFKFGFTATAKLSERELSEWQQLGRTRSRLLGSPIQAEFRGQAE